MVDDGLERYAVYCVPYPFVAWLVECRRPQRIPGLACIAVAGSLVLGWPWLHDRLHNQTADVLRHELGVPGPMLYTVDSPGAQPVGGYFLDDSGLSETYRIAGYSDPSNADYPGYDLVLTVFPVSAASPCGVIGNLLLDTTGTIGGDPQSTTCATQANGMWSYGDGLDDTTQIKRDAGYFVALTATDTASGLSSRFPAMFANLHHPSNAQLVAIGLAGPPSALQ